MDLELLLQGKLRASVEQAVVVALALSKQRKSPPTHIYVSLEASKEGNVV